MRIDLIDYTGCGSGDPWYAANLLIWTKRTRIEMSPGGLMEIKGWSEEQKISELQYMSRTIPSSWEFVSYTFLASDVTRAFTHQLVRTRTGSYAQQNQSVQQMSNWKTRIGPSIAGNEELENHWNDAIDGISESYDALLEMGAKVEDARGLLPTNIFTNIVFNWNLRVCCDTFRKRASSERGHGEYHEVIDQMRQRILEVHPWAAIFLDRDIDKAAREAYELIKQIEDKDLRMELSKRIDQITTQS